MDSWSTIFMEGGSLLLIVARHQLALGLIINTRKMTIAITVRYLTDTFIIQTTCQLGRNYFRANGAAQLVGKLIRLREGASWIRYLVAHLYASITFALAQNEMFLNLMSSEFQRHINMTKDAGFKNMYKFVCFTIKKTAKLARLCSVEYNIVLSI